MGTGETIPGWVAEIQIMERFGWTERELFEEVSLETISRLSVLNRLRAKAEEMKGKGRRGSVGGSGAALVKEVEFRA